MAMTSNAPAIMLDSYQIPGVPVPGDAAPVARIDPTGLRSLGMHLTSLFTQYKSDRQLQEQRWLRNLRQYLGYYDPEVMKLMAPDRSQAYPKITRVKCISMLARIMDMMFPSDDKNWTINATPSADMAMPDVIQAIKDAQARDQAADPNSPPPPLTSDYVQEAVQTLATKRAKMLSTEIDRQLQELGGDQSYDVIALNNEVVASGILYGLGVLRGPYVREMKTATWTWDAAKNMPVAKTKTSYKPQFDFLSVWDFYPDLSAKRLEDGDGHFVRTVMSRSQVRELADRDDFFGKVIKDYLKAHTIGNYRPQTYESELRTMGIKTNVNEQKSETSKYEIIAWHGPISGTFLQAAGVDVADDKLADEIDAEVWMLDNIVIKATMNPWAELGLKVKTTHSFVFDRDDTAPIGFGLPNVLRDTQMSISAAVRMLLDNASITCGPIMEMNTTLLRADQDFTALAAYKTFYRDDDGPSAQFPAVRAINIDGHLAELEKIVDMFMHFADIETFVGPMTGGDMSKMPSEPMRNAAGASMMLGNAALPFKQIIRNFDKFTESVILSLVQFNRQFNPDVAPTSEYGVVARGATSLIAKEIRGMQVDQLATTLSPEDRIHVNARKLLEARFAVRDLDDMLVSEAEASRKQAANDAGAAAQQQQQSQLIEAQIRKTLTDAFKNMALGQKNQMTANAEAVSTAIDVLERGEKNGLKPDPQSAPAPAAPALPSPDGQPAPAGDPNAPAFMPGGGDGTNGGMPPGGVPGLAGAGQGM